MVLKTWGLQITLFIRVVRLLSSLVTQDRVFQGKRGGRTLIRAAQLKMLRVTLGFTPGLAYHTKGHELVRWVSWLGLGTLRDATGTGKVGRLVFNRTRGNNWREAALQGAVPVQGEDVQSPVQGTAPTRRGSGSGPPPLRSRTAPRPVRFRWKSTGSEVEFPRLPRWAAQSASKLGSTQLHRVPTHPAAGSAPGARARAGGSWGNHTRSRPHVIKLDAGRGSRRRHVPTATTAWSRC